MSLDALLEFSVLVECLYLPALSTGLKLVVSHSLCTSVGMFSYQTYLFLAMCYLQVRQPLLPLLLLLHSSLCFPHKSLGSPRRAVKKKKEKRKKKKKRKGLSAPAVANRGGAARWHERAPETVCHSVCSQSRSVWPEHSCDAISASGRLPVQMDGGELRRQDENKDLGTARGRRKKRTGNFFASPVKHQGSSRSVITHRPPWHFPALSHTE